MDQNASLMLRLHYIFLALMFFTRIKAREKEIYNITRLGH